MFTRKGNSKTNWGRQTQSTPEPTDDAPSHDQQQPPAEISQEQRAAAMDAAKFPPPPVPDTTVIGKNFNLEGENIVIRCKGTLSINGTVDAHIHSEQLTISDSAHITGMIAADEINIHGQVEGSVNGAQVTLHESADVSADINAQFLSIKRGAKFDGRSRRVTDVAEIAPKLMAGANDAENLTSALSASTQSESTQTSPEQESRPEIEPSATTNEPAQIFEPTAFHATNGALQEHTGDQAATQPTETVADVATTIAHKINRYAEDR